MKIQTVYQQVMQIRTTKVYEASIEWQVANMKHGTKNIKAIEIC